MKDKVVDYLMNRCGGKSWDFKNKSLNQRVEELELALQLANERIRQLEIEIEYYLLETRKNGV
jgi:hypothetical protein